MPGHFLAHSFACSKEASRLVDCGSQCASILLFFTCHCSSHLSGFACCSKKWTFLAFFTQAWFFFFLSFSFESDQFEDTKRRIFYRKKKTSPEGALSCSIGCSSSSIRRLLHYYARGGRNNSCCAAATARASTPIILPFIFLCALFGYI